MVCVLLVLDFLDKNNETELFIYENFYERKTYLPVMPVVGMFIDLYSFTDSDTEKYSEILNERQIKKIVIINDEEIELWIS